MQKELKMQDKRDEKEKNIYEKPRLRTIELAAEEVLGIGCKIAPGHPSGVGGNCSSALCSTNIGS
ncbi:MAG: hypothetical protein C0402_16775 [Thermodesulfovibrio sp.]|nr:hypothetical protein [Thermodesulfovibrio sp.]